MSHFNDHLQSVLQYARNLENTITYDSIKRVVPWDADYFTHNSLLYYPVVEQAMSLNAIPRMSYLKLTGRLNLQAERPDERMWLRQWKSHLTA